MSVPCEEQAPAGSVILSLDDTTRDLIEIAAPAEQNNETHIIELLRSMNEAHVESPEGANEQKS